MSVHPLSSSELVSVPVTGPTLVVGFDGGEAAQAALEYAAKRAAPLGRLVVVHAYAPAPAWFGAPSYRSDDPAREHGHSVLDRIDPALPGDVSLDTELVAKAPPKALVDAARRNGADEIVVGSHGRWPGRPGSASVLTALLAVADRPVTVVPQR